MNPTTKGILTLLTALILPLIMVLLVLLVVFYPMPTEVLAVVTGMMGFLAVPTVFLVRGALLKITKG